MDQGPCGLRTPVAIARYVDGTHRVRFDAMSFRRGGRGCLGTHKKKIGRLDRLEKAPA
jgi:hypothetical protein